MTTAMEGSEKTVSPTPCGGGAAADRIRLRPAQSEALEFLRSPGGVAAKVLVGPRSSGKTTVLDVVCAEFHGQKVLRSSGSATTVSALLKSLLDSAGLSLEQLSCAEQHDLLTVFLEHQSHRGRKVIIIVDAAERLGPDAWQELEWLHARQLESGSTLELIVTGRPEILRPLQSPIGGWRRVHTRVHKLDAPVADVAAAVPHPEAPVQAVREDTGPVAPEELIISRRGEVIGRACLGIRTLVGRSAHNDICLNHPKVSRHHAVIVGTPDGHYVVDLNSKNGLIVNGERAASAVLLDGAVIGIGPYRLKFVARGSVSNGDPRPGGLSLSRTATMRVGVLPDVSLRRVK